MKAKLLFEREIQEFHPGTQLPFAPKSLVDQCIRRGNSLFAPIGTIVEGPDCWRIVRMGQAEAADDECKAKAEQSDNERAATLHAARRLDAGIDPADFELFDKGYIAGYDKAGAYRPGPNWAEFQKQQIDKPKEPESDI